MEKFFTLIRSHPCIAALAGVALVIIGLAAFFVVLFLRAGMSMKPLVSMGVFMGIIIVPLVSGLILRQLDIIPELVWSPASKVPIAVENVAKLSHHDGKFEYPEVVFGKGFDPNLVHDVRPLFEDCNPEISQMAVLRGGGMVIVSRFLYPKNAYDALNRYAYQLGLELPEASPDGAFTLSVPDGVVRMLVAGQTLFIWRTANDSAAAECVKASSGCFHFVAETSSDPRMPKAFATFGFGVLLLTCVAVVWFFKGSTWAASIKPSGNPIAVCNSHQLRDALLALPKANFAYDVHQGSDANEIEVTWKTDAAWLDFARVNGLQRVHRLVIRLDEKSRQARIREYSRAIDFSAGRGGASSSWQMSTGVVFFEYRTEKNIGLQLDPKTGAPSASLVSEYTFNLQELKAPFIAAVLEAGWTWKPVIWDAPRALRWFTE